MDKEHYCFDQGLEGGEAFKAFASEYLKVSCKDLTLLFVPKFVQVLYSAFLCVAFLWVAGSSQTVGRSFSRMVVLNVLTVGLWTLPRHTSPTATHPKSRCWAKGAWWGPLMCSLTLCALKTSRPNSRSISASESSSGMNLAMGHRWGWCRTAFGVGISLLLLWMSWHSISGCNGITDPSRDWIWKPCSHFAPCFNKTRVCS